MELAGCTCALPFLSVLSNRAPAASRDGAKTQQPARSMTSGRKMAQVRPAALVGVVRQSTSSRLKKPESSNEMPKRKAHANDKPLGFPVIAEIATELAR